ncbi:MAG TPA: hypothetical protein PK720_00040 [bacterium]|nr:hypothetical protein [bacterium]
MQLQINTSEAHVIEIALLKERVCIAKLTTKVARPEAEKLLPLVEKLLRNKQVSLTEIQSITVENRGEGFTNLRLGIAIANTLAFALNVPLFSGAKQVALKDGLAVVAPHYNRPPNITLKKKKS